MSHFYGVLKGSRGEATRCGAKQSGLVTRAASYQGSVHVDLRHDEKSGLDIATVSLQPWHGAGKSLLLYADAVSGERSTFSATEKLCLDFLTSTEKPVEKGDKVVVTVDKELYKELRRFMLARSIGNI
jgi:hypothetical protein